MPLGRLLNHVRACLRFQFDLSERGLPLRDILLKDVQKGFCLLRTKVHALKVVDGYGVRRGLLNGSERQKEIPQVRSHLDAVGIALAILRRIDKLNLRLRVLGVHEFALLL